MKPLPSAAKGSVGAQARENMKTVLSAGNDATGSKSEKTGNQCQAHAIFHKPLILTHMI